MARGQSNDFLNAPQQDALGTEEDTPSNNDFLNAQPDEQEEEDSLGTSDFLNATEPQDQGQTDFFNATPEDRKGKNIIGAGEKAQNEILRERGIDPEDVPDSKLQSNLNYFIQGLGDVVEGGLKATGGFLNTIGGGEVKPTKDEEGNITGFEQSLSPEEGLLYKAGEWVSEQLRETFPTNPEFRDELLSKLSRGAGTLVSQGGLAAVTRGRSLLTQGKQAVATGASFSGLEYSRALESGADPDTAFNSMLMNIPIHSFEQLPVMNATKKLDKASGGMFKQILKQGFKGGLYEGAQEVGQEFGANLIAKTMYDDTANLIEGVKEGGEVGFVLGMAMTGIGVPLRRMRDDITRTPEERAEAQKTLELVENEIQGLPDGVQDFLQQEKTKDFFSAAPEGGDLIHSESILYHGTGTQFAKFDDSKLGEGTLADDAMLGFHFTENKEVADKVFAVGNDPEVKAAKLNIKRPFSLDEIMRNDSDPDTIKDFHFVMTGERVEQGSEGYQRTESILKEGMTTEEFKNEISRDVETTKKRLKELGYDSIITNLQAVDQVAAREEGIRDISGREVIVFESNQIEVLNAPTELDPHTSEEIEQEAETGFEGYLPDAFGLEAEVKGEFVRWMKNPDRDTSKLKEIVFSQEDAFLNRGHMSRTFNDLEAVFEAKKSKLNKKRLERAYREFHDQKEQEEVSPEQNTNLISPKPDTFGKRIMKKMEQWLAPRGMFPKELREFFRTRPADVKVETRRMQRTIRDLNKKLKSEFGISKMENAMFSDKVPQDLRDNMRQVLVGEREADVLPDEIAESVTEMRDHIDRLSRTMIKNGVAEGDLAITFRKNIGYYVHRTYKVHNVDNWSEKVPQSVKNRAKALIRKENPNATEAQVKNAIERLLTKENDPVSAFQEGKIGSMDLSPLKKREDLPEVIRELLGEETNAVVNYGKSVIKMANLIENHKTLSALRDQFEGKYFFKLDDENIPEDATEEIAGKQSDSMGPLAGLWTSPEIKQAFQEASTAFNNMSKTHRFILRLNAGAKFAKTILNPVTIGRNVVGGTGFLIASGNIPSKRHFKKGLQAAKDVFSSPNSKEAREAVDELIRLGITGKSAKAGEINDLLKEISLEDDLNSTFEKLTGGQGLTTKAKSMVKMASDFYQAGDDFLRISMYYSNLQRYKEADPSITKEEVARITNDTYQNYDEAGNSKFITAARRNPLVAPFLPFTFEVARTTMNNYKLMRREISSDNPKMRKIGYSRLAGLSVSSLGTLSASLASLAMLGIGDEEDKDVRRHSAPWDKTGTLLYSDVDKANATAEYFNLSYIDPYQYLKDPLLSLIANDSEEEFMDQLGISIRELLEPILGPELFAQKFGEWVANKRSSGGQVYNPQADLDQKTVDTIAHFWDAFEPGFLDWGGKVVDASTNYRSDHTVSGQIASLFGFRSVKIDFEKSLDFKVNDFVKARRDAKNIYNSALYDEQTGVVEEERARAEANTAYQDDWANLSRDIEAARRMGVSTYKIKEILEGKNLSQDDIRNLLYGSFQEFERDYQTGR